MSAIVIIPSRYQSTRFPGKPLSLLLNRPMIQHVYERAKAAVLIKEVFVATDSRSIFDVVCEFGGKAVMTLGSHNSGTDRIAEAAEIISNDGYSADIIVNVQGDEPMIMPQMIDDVVSLMEDGRAGIGTLVKRIDNAVEIQDPNVVKVVFNRDGFALYFSRSPIPYHRDLFSTKYIKNVFAKAKPDQKTSNIPGFPAAEVTMFKHIGLYAYRRNVLKMFSTLPPSQLEETEKLEQLRAIENGIAIKIGETIYDTIGVDTPIDLKKVEKCLSISL